MDEFALLDATAQARLVARREVTPLELVDAAIARIERLDGRVNAVISRQFEQAREQAREPLPDGPFRGVPFLLKDLGTSAQRGHPQTFGCRALAHHVPDYDCELTLRYQRAGLIVLGRTSTPEFGIPPITEPLLFGPCRNPWDLGHSPGGSSGGAAAAVAARMVPAAHGSDAGGSIRIPASACGLFGLKPTRARHPAGPRLGETGVAGLSSDHCVSISVRDSAALLDAISGPEPGAPYIAPPPVRPYAQEVGTPVGELRIGVMRIPLNGVPVHPDCLAALDDAIALCRSLGHEVVEAQPVLDDPEGFAQAFVNAYLLMAASNVDMIEALVGRPAVQDDVEPLTWAMAQAGRALGGGEYLRGLRMLHAGGRQVARFFATHDLVLSPTMARPPLRIGELRYPAEDPVSGLIEAGKAVPFTGLFNATGQPAMNVPLYWNADGLPIGVQFAARYGDEATLVRLASQLEQARPWAHRLPPLLQER